MIPCIIIVALTCLTMILCVLFKPQFKFGKIALDSYWVIALVGALLIIICGFVDLGFLWKTLTENTAVNPIKILVLFISMTVLSIFLDEVGFFRYLANLSLKKAKSSQIKLFVILYVVVSILTVFTSNDIIVLTFTPFICYFCKNAKVNPIPYLIGEFIAANTMSMTLIIGNPTNIYIATAYGINFFDYFKVMILPTLASAIVSFIILYLLFRKDLKKPASAEIEDVKIENKPLLIIGLVHLSVCTLILAVGPYFNIEMWIVSFISALSLFVFVLVFSAIKKSRPKELTACLKRAPWQLIPFVLSMFIMVLAFKNQGITDKIGDLLGSNHSVLKYGVVSYLSANLINNIPMSVLFCPIMEGLTGTAASGAIYATIVGSNLGALLTPIGALAGIMWSSLLKKHDVKLSFGQFVKYGAMISIPSLAANLAILFVII